jgi:RecB family exonuclease
MFAERSPMKQLLLAITLALFTANFPLALPAQCTLVYAQKKGEEKKKKDPPGPPVVKEKREKDKQPPPKPKKPS